MTSLLQRWKRGVMERGERCFFFFISCSLSLSLCSSVSVFLSRSLSLCLSPSLISMQGPSRSVLQCGFVNAAACKGERGIALQWRVGCEHTHTYRKPLLCCTRKPSLDCGLSIGLDCVLLSFKWKDLLLSFCTYWKIAVACLDYCIFMVNILQPIFQYNSVECHKKENQLSAAMSNIENAIVRDTAKCVQWLYCSVDECGSRFMCCGGTMELNQEHAYLTWGRVGPEAWGVSLPLGSPGVC